MAAPNGARQNTPQIQCAQILIHPIIFLIFFPFFFQIVATEAVAMAATRQASAVRRMMLFAFCLVSAAVQTAQGQGGCHGRGCRVATANACPTAQDICSGVAECVPGCACPGCATRASQARTATSKTSTDSGGKGDEGTKPFSHTLT